MRNKPKKQRRKTFCCPSSCCGGSGGRSENNAGGDSSEAEDGVQNNIEAESRQAENSQRRKESQVNGLKLR